MFGDTVRDLHFTRNIIHALFTLGSIKLATLTSIYFARLAIIVLFSIPGAFVIYFLAHNQYRLQKHASVAVAVLPFILPNEAQVPTYIIGSYMLPGIIAGLVCAWFILEYSKQPKLSVTYLILALVFYFLATESTELFASMLPVFLFLIFAFRKLTWKQILLGALLSVIAVTKSLRIINNPHGKINSVENDLPLKEIIFRIGHFPDYINPFYGIGNILILNIIIVLLILFAAGLVIKDQSRLTKILEPASEAELPRNKYFNFTYFFLFPLVWVAFSASPFLFFSEASTSRYFTVASVASGFLIITSLHVIAGRYTNSKIPLVIISILVILSAGINRQFSVKNYFHDPQEQINSIRNTLASCNLPVNAQVVIATPAAKGLMIGYGVTTNSIGSLQFILNRRDVEGQIMKEKQFYDPFSLYKKPHRLRNADIDTLKSTFFFRCYQDDAGKNRRFYYALRWNDEKSKDSPWTIYKFDDNGKKSNLVSGKGYDNYVKITDSLSLQGIKRDEIMFGGIPVKTDILRLGL
jgi:hypothetical protein